MKAKPVERCVFDDPHSRFRTDRLRFLADVVLDFRARFDLNLFARRRNRSWTYIKRQLQLSPT